MAAIILGAGLSTRMGRPKLLLPWGNTTIIGHEIQKWSRLVSGLTLVYGGGDLPLLQELDRLQFPSSQRLENSRPQNGMLSSILVAARREWPAKFTHFVIALGDQPQIASAILEQLLASAAQQPNAIWQPSFEGRPRHPVIFPRMIFEKLRITPCATLKDFLKDHAASRLLHPLNDPAINLDLDFPAEYDRARALYDSPR